MKQGPFALVGLCCPGRRHYYDPLRLPLGCRPLPGVTGYRQAHSLGRRPRGRGGSLQFPRQPSDRSTPTTPEGSSSPAPGSLAASVAFALPPRARHPLVLLTEASVTTLTGFASCCGPVSRSPPHRDFVAPLRRRHLCRRREPCYQGPWRLPGPDLRRLAAVSLSLGYVITNSFPVMAPELLDARWNPNPPL